MSTLWTSLVVTRAVTRADRPLLTTTTLGSTSTEMMRGSALYGLWKSGLWKSGLCGLLKVSPAVGLGVGDGVGATVSAYAGAVASAVAPMATATRVVAARFTMRVIPLPVQERTPGLGYANVVDVTS